MPTQYQYINIPLMYGDGVNNVTGDFETRMPVNMLVISREVKGAPGYLRIFPGITKQNDVAGLSRGVHWNTVKNGPARVMGNKLYLAGEPFADVPLNSTRTPMAHSRTSQGVVDSGILTLYRYDGEVKQFANWPGEDGTNYDWGTITDVCHLQQRYIFCTAETDTFWCSDLDDESHPDKIAPAYRAGSMADGIVAIRAWRDFVICFGQSTIEFFALTGDSQNIYQVQPSYFIDVGTIGKETVCSYLNSFAFITSPSVGVVTIGLMNPGGGAWSDIGSVQVKKILAKYKPEDLVNVKMESVSFESHNLLIVHLPNETLVYDNDVSTAMSTRIWTIIKTGIVGSNGSDAYRGIDFCNEGNVITVADKREGVIGTLDNSTCDQYGEQQEIILYSKIAACDQYMLNDLEIDANSGADSRATRLMISFTEDGVSYSPEKLIDYSEPQVWLKRPILRKLGIFRQAVGFKFRIVGSGPATLSRARARIS